MVTNFAFSVFGACYIGRIGTAHHRLSYPEDVAHIG